MFSEECSKEHSIEPSHLVVIVIFFLSSSLSLLLLLYLEVLDLSLPLFLLLFAVLSFAILITKSQFLEL